MLIRRPDQIGLCVPFLQMKPTVAYRSDCSCPLRTVNVTGNFPPKRFGSNKKKVDDTHSTTVPSGRRAFKDRIESSSNVDTADSP